MYSKECVETFLKQQGQLFDEPVAETYEEAEEFLEECMAVVVKNIKEVKEYLDESGYQGSLLTISIPDEYVEHGNVDILREEVGIDAYSIQRRIEEVLCGQ